jgi:hypothetical protein
MFCGRHGRLPAAGHVKDVWKEAAVVIVVHRRDLHL